MEDVIVVGSGPAGATAAYVLAKEGHEPILLERGRMPGTKTLYGGKVHVGPLKRVFGDELDKCPIERWISRERFTICGPDCSLTLEYRAKERAYFTAYLPKLTNWISGLAEEAGAMVITETVVERLVVEDGMVKGVMTEDGEELKARAVIVAEGANRLILEKSGLAKKPSPEDIALGSKLVVRLKEMEEKLGIHKGEGLAWIFVGFIPHGGGFLYTFGDAVSVGVVVHNPINVEREFYEVIEDFRHLSPIYDILEGGELIEYGAHIAPFSSRFTLDRFYGKGYLVVGDAAGLLANHGFAFRGVDHAVYSGYLAGKAIARGLNSENLGRAFSEYDLELKNSFIMKNLRVAKKLERSLADPRLYSNIPKLLTSFTGSVMSAEEMPTKLRGHFFKVADDSGLGKFDMVSLIWRLLKL